MKKIHFLLSLILTFTLTIGQVWAETGSDVITFSAQSLSNQASVDGTNFNLGSYFTVTCTKNGAGTAPTYYTSGTAVRCYVTKNTSNGNIITVARNNSGAIVNAYITKVTYTGTHSKKGTTSFTYSGTTTASDATSATYAAASQVTEASATLNETGNSANGQFYLTGVTVEYVYTPSSTPTCETPTFDPVDGETFEESISVTLSAESGTTIHYTTDGSDPTTSSNVYSTALTFTETTTLKAIAAKEGSNNSSVATATYTKVVAVHGYAIDFENDIDAYVDWEFSNLTIDNSITAHSTSHFAKTNGTTTASATTKEKVATPGVLTFYISKIGTNTNASSYWQARVSSDGSEWTVVGDNNSAAVGVTAGTWNECTADLSSYSNVYVQVYYTGTTAVRAIDDISLAMASATPKAATPTFATGDENFLTSTSVTLACTTEGASIYYTTNGDEPTSSSTLYEGAIPLSATTTIKAIAVAEGYNNSAVAEKTFTKATILTVAEARAAIDAGTGTTGVYASGIVSQIVTAYNSTYGNISYNISDDGLTTSNQLQAFRGKAAGAQKFTSADDVQVGDKVLVYGNLTKYNSTYEFTEGNQLIKRSAHLAWTGVTEDAFAASLEGGNTFPTLTNSDNVSVSYSSSETNVATINASTGAIEELAGIGSTIITASFIGNDTYFEKTVSYTLNVSSSVFKADISFEENGGSAVDDLTEQTNLPSPLPTITKDGKNFGGWFTDEDCTAGNEAVAGAAVESSDPITLYAKWLDPYTIAQAKAVIDALPANGTIANQYVSGIISQIDTYVSASHAITYWISADGTTTSQLEVYKGLIGNAATPLNKDAFDAKENLELGDEVVVCGTLKKYNDTYEFDQNNTIYSFTRPEKPSITANPTTISNVAAEGVTNQTIALTYSNIENYQVTATLYDDANGETAFSGNWLTASVSDANNYATITYSVSANEGEARTAYIKVYAVGDNNKEATKIISVSQVAYVAPAAPAELPFAFDGGRADIESAQGMSQEGLDTDYGSSPKLKFNSTGDCVIINIASDPGQLTYDIKGNSFSGSTFKVQESADGSNYSDVATYDALSDTQNESKTLEQTTRFVKFIYTNKSNGNVALGNIAIAAYVESATLQSIAISGQPETTTYDAGNVFNVTGLVVTGTYDHGDPAAITEGITWEVRTNSASDAVALANYTLMQGQTALQVRATVSEIASNWYDVTGLTVNEHEVTPGKYDILLNNALWESELTGSLTGANLKDYSGSQNDISFAYNKGTGSNMYFNATQTRLYNGNELVVTAPTGYVIEKVEGLVATVQANAGTISENVWTGNVNSVTFSHKNSTGNSQLGSISVTFAAYVPATVATPVISPNPSVTYTEAQSVTITCETDGTTIYYTTDGTDPDNTSTQYTSAITVGATMTIKAIAYKDNDHSEVAAATYTINIPEDESVRKTWDLTTDSYVKDPEPSESLIQWTATYVSMKNERTGTETGVNNYIPTAKSSTRFYKDNKLTITPNGKKITSITFTATSDNYASAFTSSKWTNATATASGSTVTVTPTDGESAISAAVGGTCGFSSVQVNYQDPESEEPIYTDIRTGLTAGNYYTVCYPKAMTAIRGGLLYSLEGKDANSVYMLQEDAPLVAGRPYILYATSEKLEAVVEGSDASAGSHNGLYGTLSAMTAGDLATAGATHMLYDNSIRPLGTNNHLAEGRAYIILSEIPGGTINAGAPGRVRAIPMHGNVATDIEATGLSDQPAKVMKDGQLFILRGERLYDMTGRLVK